MATTEALKRQIDTARDLGVVVRTMKNLAAVNIRQFEAATESLTEYVRTIRTAMEMLLWNDRDLQQSQKATGSHRTGVIAFGSDQGMCGGFNDAMAEEVNGLVHESGRVPATVPVIVLGRRLASRLLDEGVAFDNSIELPGSVTGMTSMLQELLPLVDDWRQDNDLDAVIVCHQRRESQTRTMPVRHQLLPVSPSDFVPKPPRRWAGRSLPLVTMPTQELWTSISRQHLFVSLFQVCAESLASENAARIAAMQAAETHIRDRLVDLTFVYQHLRQEAITEELLDVISGFEALMSGLSPRCRQLQSHEEVTRSSSLHDKHLRSTN